jgi:Domain of unknown function (DUF3560)
MTYRERREARAERLHDWAASREAKADAAHEAAHRIADGIPFGQPILVGHHSEGRARRDQSRMDSSMRASIDNARMADRHESRAANIEAQLQASIYSDDENAVEALEARIATLEAKRDRIKAENAAYRKEHKAELAGLSVYGRDQVMPHPGWELTNLSGNISRNRKRLEGLQAQAASGTDESPRGSGASRCPTEKL